MCRVLEVKEGSYYAWRKRGMSKRARSNAALREQLLEIARQTNQSYGSRRSTQLLRSAGVFVNRKRIAKLMRDNGIRPVRLAAKPPMPAGTADGANVLNRRFRVAEPNRYWASDITYIPHVKAGCTWRSRWICTPAESSAGRWTTHDRHAWCSMR